MNPKADRLNERDQPNAGFVDSFLLGWRPRSSYIETLRLSAMGKQISLDINPFYCVFIFFHDHFALEA
jgi:hypothetical protein